MAHVLIVLREVLLLDDVAVSDHYQPVKVELALPGCFQHRIQLCPVHALRFGRGGSPAVCGPEIFRGDRRRLHADLRHGGLRGGCGLPEQDSEHDDENKMRESTIFSLRA